MFTIRPRGLRQIRACAAALKASNRLHYDLVTLPVDLVHSFSCPRAAARFGRVEGRINTLGELAGIRPCDTGAFPLGRGGVVICKHSSLTPETAIAHAIDLVTTLNTHRLLPLSGERQSR